MLFFFIILFLLSLPASIALAIILKVTKKKLWYLPLIYLVLLLLINGISSLFINTEEDIGSFYNKKQEIFNRNADLFVSIAEKTEGGVLVCKDHSTNAEVFSGEQIEQIKKDIEELKIDCIVLDYSEEVIDFRIIGWSNAGYFYLIHPEQYSHTSANDTEKRINEHWVRYK